MGFIDVTTLTSAFTGAKIVNKDRIDSINGNFLMYFIIIIIFKGCYNITFISQVIK